MNVDPSTGKRADPSRLVNVPKLITAYYAEAPDPAIPEQRVAFGTSGHWGCGGEEFVRSFPMPFVTSA